MFLRMNCEAVASAKLVPVCNTTSTDSYSITECTAPDAVALTMLS
jgi:hypothetical protein